MGTALQVFYNLGTLITTVEEVVNKVRNNLTSSVKEALDPTTLSQAQPNTGRKSSGPLDANDIFRSTLEKEKKNKIKMCH